jgi:hypothetical protein
MTTKITLHLTAGAEKFSDFVFHVVTSARTPYPKLLAKFAI